MRVFFTIVLVALSLVTFSQDNQTALKKNIVSADIGLFTAFLNYERYLGGLFTVKTELGVGFETGSDIFSGNQYFEFTPIIVAEPRYYYNFNRRVQRGRKTSYNAANYIALTASYYTSPLIISNVDYKIIQNIYSLVPKWGIKRTVGKRWNFECAAGAGLVYNNHNLDTDIGFDLRFGYNIK